jgi:hypothetical protein
MVRSNGESGRDFFHLVDQIRAEVKYFNYGRLEVGKVLATEGQADLESELTTMSEHGPVNIPLRLFLKRRKRYWSVALLLHGMRVDGIDWLHSYPCEDRSQGTGWHRHYWDADAMNADIHVPLPLSFGSGLVHVQDFLIRASKEMRIDWNANDVGFTGFLPLS